MTTHLPAFRTVLVVFAAILLLGNGVGGPRRAAAQVLPSNSNFTGGPQGIETSPVKGNWSVARNWAPKGVPASVPGTIINLVHTSARNAAAFTSTQDIGAQGAAFTLSSLTVTNNLNNGGDTLDGGPLRFVNFPAPAVGPPAPPVLASAGNQTFTVKNDITIANPATFTQNGRGTVFLTGNLVNAGLTVTGKGSGQFSFPAKKGVISGAGGITINSAPKGAMLALAGQNTFTGGVTLTAGRLRLGSNSTTNKVGTLVSGPVGTGTLAPQRGERIHHRHRRDRSLQDHHRQCHHDRRECPDR